MSGSQFDPIREQQEDTSVGGRVPRKGCEGVGESCGQRKLTNEGADEKENRNEFAEPHFVISVRRARLLVAPTGGPYSLFWVFLMRRAYKGYHCRTFRKRCVGWLPQAGLREPPKDWAWSSWGFTTEE